jgi:NAD(P)H dehydrogenase (quinone)
MTVRTAVIYYSATGNIRLLAEAIGEGAASVGSEVRLRKVRETAPPEAIASNPAWQEHSEQEASVAEATLDDLRWADGYIFGTPSRFGNVAAQLKQFMDMTGPLWSAGELADKTFSGFTSAMNAHGGNESTLLALYQTAMHWGTIVVAPGYTTQEGYAAGGNPYGTAHASGTGRPGAAQLAAARAQGARVATITARLQSAALVG